MTLGSAYNRSLPPEGKPTNAKPKVVDGRTWTCFSVGVMRYEWRTDGDLAAGQRYGRETYYARVGDKRLDTRFRSLETAMRAAIKAAS